MQKLVNLHAFPGFYESALDAMIDDEIEQIFNIDESGCNSHIPSEFYDANVDYGSIHESLSKGYLDAWCSAFKDATEIELAYEYESVTSPKSYNFETDRLFMLLEASSINALFAASEENNHKELAQHIKDRFTSCDGFISSYPNDLGVWLQKPVLTWDHNELGTLLDAVLAIYCTERDIERDFNTWDLMEGYRCNGHLSEAVWFAIPKTFREFADLQREHMTNLDFDVFRETGAAYEEGSDEPCPPLRCKETLELNL